MFHEFALDAVKAGELSTIFAVDGANLGEGVRLAMRLDLPVRKRCEGSPRVLFESVFDQVCLTERFIFVCFIFSFMPDC